jgi:glutamate 5-kinase
LYDSDPNKSEAQFIPEVRSNRDLQGVVATEGSAIGTGGMTSKLSAALLAADAGIPVLLAAASSVRQALTDASAGTVFVPRRSRMSARKFWVRHGADVQGKIYLDQGAVHAFSNARNSLLAAGIVRTAGDFHSGEVVTLMNPADEPVARGVVSYSAEEIKQMVGKSTQELPSDYRRPVVHADDLVAF